MSEPKPKVTRLCLCGQIRIDFPAANMAVTDLPAKHRQYAEENIEGYDDGGWIHLETGCEVETASLFAPGHDARFKSLLQTAFRLGGDVTFGEVSTGPVEFAKEHTPNLADAIATQVSPPARKRKVTTPPVLVRAKVGRWEYDGVIEQVGTGPDATEHFIYTATDGTSKASSTLTIVEAGNE